MRLLDRISSVSSTAGDIFRIEVVGDVMVDGARCHTGWQYWSGQSDISRKSWINGKKLPRYPISGTCLMVTHDLSLLSEATKVYTLRPARWLPEYAVYALANPFICGYRESHYLFRDALQ